ncbi:hypothetical protein [Streptosporangium roseum]|uniref:hypothetical protein n=1 Tax=Streptosporangium roseum TaxID=2001 RepID=UPI0004CD39F9
MPHHRDRPAVHRPTDVVPVVPFGTTVVATVGDIAGLRPRRRKGDGGEVPGADVDDVDALGEPAWSTVAAGYEKHRNRIVRLYVP